MRKVKKAVKRLAPKKAPRRPPRVIVPPSEREDQEMIAFRASPKERLALVAYAKRFGIHTLSAALRVRLDLAGLVSAYEEEEAQRAQAAS